MSSPRTYPHRFDTIFGPAAVAHHVIFVRERRRRPDTPLGETKRQIIQSIQTRNRVVLHWPAPASWHLVRCLNEIARCRLKPGTGLPSSRVLIPVYFILGRCAITTNRAIVCRIAQCTTDWLQPF